MKKILALMLVLCMALASVPTLAEATDFTGSWYLILTEVTCATFELNADGTCVGTTAVPGVGDKLNGTWSADGNAVTLTIGEQALPLTYDGTDLTFSAGEVATAKDGSAISFPLKFSRNPGKVTVEELNAYATNGTIPEGKTKEEMEEAETQLGLLFLVAAESALIEETYSGTWYLIMSGLTCATFELNADGTCVGTSTVSGEEKKLEGTWTADAETVILTVGGQSLVLAYDGTDLVFASMAIYVGTNNSSPTAMMKFSRTAGVTVEELKAYTSGGAIPEGKTKEEMDAVETQLGLMFVVAAFAD